VGGRHRAGGPLCAAFGCRAGTADAAAKGGPSGMPAGGGWLLGPVLVVGRVLVCPGGAREQGHCLGVGGHWAVQGRGLEGWAAAGSLSAGCCQLNQAVKVFPSSCVGAGRALCLGQTGQVAAAAACGSCCVAQGGSRGPGRLCVLLSRGCAGKWQGPAATPSAYAAAAQACGVQVASCQGHGVVQSCTNSRGVGVVENLPLAAVLCPVPL
jgi:hypothetical protein